MVCNYVKEVSIHAPGRGATALTCPKTSESVEFQFTHPGGVRPDSAALILYDDEVSIHAPGRGATDSLPPIL